jgi:hypothetical protein
VNILLTSIQAQSGTASGLPSWLTTGWVPVVGVIAIGIVIIYFWIDFRLKRIQRELHTLGRSYYDREKIIIDDLKAGRITQGEYRKKHSELVNEMRRESRKITEGPPQ